MKNNATIVIFVNRAIKLKSKPNKHRIKMIYSDGTFKKRIQRTVASLGDEFDNITVSKCKYVGPGPWCRLTEKNIKVFMIYHRHWQKIIKR